MVGLGIDWLTVGGVSDEEIGRLRAAGIETAGDVLDLRLADLAERAVIPIDRAVVVRRAARGGPRTPEAIAQTGIVSTSTLLLPSDLSGTLASDLIRARRQSPYRPIATMCAALDQILGGGVPIGQLTEICGAPGLGKTQLCMQLACTAQIPASMQGNDGAAVYIDTEGSLVASRLHQIADALCALLQRSGVDRAAEAVLARVHVYRVHSAMQQLSVIRVLPAFLAQHPDVRLLVVDSVAFHLRHGIADLSQRTRLLGSMAQQLTFLAQTFSLAVVLTNQMAVGADRATLVPALGPNWAHHANHRVVLEPGAGEGITVARLVKSPSRAQAQTEFAITKAGIRSPSLDRTSPGSR